MTKYKILIEGYAKELRDGWKASSTTVLIQDSGKKIIVDPGINRKLLLKSLKNERLEANDIDIVFMTHYHPDHNFLSGIFENAIALDDGIVYKDDVETEYSKKIPGTEIEVISTPGHESFHASLKLEAEDGIVVVAGDVFWWMDEEEQKTDNIETLLSHEDPFVKDTAKLTKSRKKLLEIADWIIPGHGKQFKVK